MKIYIVGSGGIGGYFGGLLAKAGLDVTLVKFANELNIPVPVNELIYKTIKR
jgi:ketopantoate reductase